MEAYRRRQQILALLSASGELEVLDLARRLGVSANTIRNDLNVLASSGALTRVRGGAAASSVTTANGVPEAVSPSFVARWSTNREAKREIARWASELVEDGDAILLDASSTVFHMAEYLQPCRDLTVVTNGIEVARAMARNPGNTVILIGGLLRPDGTPVGGLQSDQSLKDLHPRIAFVSCAGYEPQSGLTETNLQEALLKKQMIATAGMVVAMVDSTKFGRVDLIPFAANDQVDRIFTDNRLDPAWVTTLRDTRICLTICDADGVSTYAPCAPTARHYTIGFANLSEQMPFAIEVRRSLEREAKQSGNIDLVIADNRLDAEEAQKVADRLIAAQPDLVIEYQLHEHVNPLLMEKYRQAGIPVIAVDIPIIGATYFGADNYRAGYVAGAALGNWLAQHWSNSYDRLVILEEPRAGAIPAARIQGQLDGLRARVGTLDSTKTLRLDSGNLTDISETAMAEALSAMGRADRVAVLTFNDEAAIGALNAGRRLGREQQLAIVGQGADRKVREEMRKPGSRIIGSTAYYPERYGRELIRLAQRILRSEAVPPAIYIEHDFILAQPETDPTGAP